MDRLERNKQTAMAFDDLMFRALAVTTLKRWAEVIRRAGIKAE